MDRSRAWIGSVAVLVAACAGSGSVTPSIGASSGAVAAAPPSNTAVVASSAPAASQAPLPDGEYLSGFISKDQAQAMLADPAIADDPAVRQFLDDYDAPARTRLKLANGHFTQDVELEGKSLGIGDEGTYAFVDDHTIALQSTHVPGTYQLGFTLTGDSLTWKVLSGQNGAGDLATVRVIFEATPFVRQP